MRQRLSDPTARPLKPTELLYVSGQLPINPADGKMPEGIEAQTEQSLKIPELSSQLPDAHSKMWSNQPFCWLT